MWEYNLNYQSDEIWSESKRVVPYLKDWIEIQRWAGTYESPYFTINEMDEFVLFISPSSKIIGFLVELKLKNNPDASFSYFIPLEMAKGVSNNELFKFPIILKCKDENIYIREADLTRQFFQVILNKIVYERKITTKNNNTVQFKRLRPISPEKFEVKLIRELGGGDTTNTNYRITTLDNSNFMTKIYRIFSRNPEVKMLESLYDIGFHKIPEPIAYANINIDTLSYPIILIYKYIDALGDGGLNFWRDLNKQMNYWRPGADIERRTVRQYCEILGRTIANFHISSSKIDDDLFKPEPIIKAQINQWIDRIKRLFVQAERNIDVAHRHLIESAEIVKNYTGERFRWAILENLEGIMKIKIHQDLHLSQMLTVRSDDDIDFVLIDFEGDPLRSPEEKFQKDPFFRDLASICTAFHYIKFNALKEYFVKKTDVGLQRFLEIYPSPFVEVEALKYKDHIGDREDYYSFPLISKTSRFNNHHVLELIVFAKKWEDFCRNMFVLNYIETLYINNMTFNFDLSDFNLFESVLEIFRAERLIQELYYEVLLRKTQTIIPILGLLELYNEDLSLKQMATGER
jgi:predicted trehalose synthase